MVNAEMVKDRIFINLWQENSHFPIQQRYDKKLQDDMGNNKGLIAKEMVLINQWKYKQVSFEKPKDKQIWVKDSGYGKKTI